MVVDALLPARLAPVHLIPFGVPPTPQEVADSIETLGTLRKQRPSVFYQPHAHGQLQFHSARHRIRAMFPGNRFGKSFAMANEANWWIQKSHPFQSTPRGFVIALWLCPQFRQFDLLREGFERDVFDAGWTWNGTDSFYTWPGKGQLWVIPGDRDAYYIQGINPDLVLCDEEPPLKLWREFQTRMFGRREGRIVRTRYVVAATATEGESWMESLMLAPWREHHRALGMNDEQAVAAQQHPDIWCWPYGGIMDNPFASAEDVKHYESIVWRSEEERQVRLRGGFASINGTYVFDRSGVAWLKGRSAELDKDIGVGAVGSLRVERPGEDAPA